MYKYFKNISGFCNGSGLSDEKINPIKTSNHSITSKCYY